MKIIPLTKGSIAVVDDDDYWHIAAMGWRQDRGYAVRTEVKDHRKRRICRMHRLIANARPGVEVDHINLDKGDNRRSNLRLCSHLQNHGNRRKPRIGRTATSKFKGVHWSRSGGKWIAMMSRNGKAFYIGRFDDELEAARAYDKAASEYRGEFALLNGV